MRIASFFAGIGGFDLGFDHAGIIPVFHCEIDPYCQRILKRHWPEVPLHDDITTLKAKDIPEYSTMCPATISDSPSTTSNGARLVSATPEIR